MQDNLVIAVYRRLHYVYGYMDNLGETHPAERDLPIRCVTEMQRIVGFDHSIGQAMVVVV